MAAHPRLQAAAGAAGTVETILDVMRVPAAATAAEDATAASLRLRISCTALFHVVRGHRGNVERACAAGVMDALSAAMGASFAHERPGAVTSVFDYVLFVLHALLEGEGSDDAARRAVHAGVLDIMVREGTQHCHPSVLAAHARLLASLELVAQRHDADDCALDGCKRCTSARDAGRMCARPGCGARGRDGGAKKLLRCGTCRAACYCGPAHQREDWARHKDACAAAALGAASEEAAGEQQ
jgi:hypothetical protein